MDANLILYVNKLHQLTQRFRGGPLLALPQIVVVGNQSAGKSSLLQNFIGKDFLPFGSDKVTRRPIMLQLIHTEVEEARKNGPTEYAIFPEENPDKKYTDFNIVKQKLQAQMNEVTKAEVVRDATIILQIYSPNVVTLTLFDLPGLVTTHVVDEPETAPELVREMVRRHIEPENVIILAVVAGNTDVVTSSAVKLAEEIDPKGDRTVLAVTMMDLVTDEDAMDKAVNLLMGKTKQYKEGIVGVISRKADSGSKRTISDIRAEEVNVLQKKFQPLVTQKGGGTLRLGSEYLQQLLSKLLVRRISEYLSDDMHKKIDQRMEECNAVLKMYGAGVEMVDKNQAVEDAIETFANLLSDAITGTAKDLTVIQPLVDRRNYDVLFTDFPAELQALRTAQMFSDEYIQKNILISMGSRAHLSAPHNAFESMVREYIDMIRKPCRNAACNVKNGLTLTVEKCGNAMPGRIAHYPALMSVIVKKTLEFLSEKLDVTQATLKTEIDMEWEYININHPDFDKACEDPALQAKVGNSPTPDIRKETVYETKKVKEMLTSSPNAFKIALFAYIDIIYRNALAMVPKVIYYCMINEITHGLERYLRAYLRDRTEDRLFDEPKDIVEKRSNAKEGIRECEEARAILSEMRQYCSRHEG